MDDRAREAQAEQKFKQKVQTFFLNHKGVTKPARKLLFFTVAKQSVSYTISQKEQFENIKIKTSRDDNGQVSEASIEYDKNGRTIVLSAGLVEPPAIIVDPGTGIGDSEGLVVKSTADPYFKDVESILG